MRAPALILLAFLLGVFTWLNRHALLFPHTLDLGFVVFKGAPLGAILLVLGLLTSLVAFAWARVQHLRAQADAARLLRDMEALRSSLDSAEHSRFQQLQAHLDQRLGAGSSADVTTLEARMDALQRDVNARFDQLEEALRPRLGDGTGR